SAAGLVCQEGTGRRADPGRYWRRPRRGMEKGPLLRAPPRLRGELETARRGDETEGNRGVSKALADVRRRLSAILHLFRRDYTHQPRVTAAHPRRRGTRPDAPTPQALHKENRPSCSKARSRDRAGQWIAPSADALARDRIAERN